MTHHPFRLAVSPVLAVFLLISGCSIFGGDDYGKARFILTPDGGGDAVTVSVEAKYHSPATGDCHLEIYDIDGENRYIQFSPLGGGSTCAGAFEARFEASGVETEVSGFVQREFGKNKSTPFATGLYSQTTGSFGTFVFYEDDLPNL